MILERTFYERDLLKVAKELLGKIIVHEPIEGKTSGMIVETEAYMGPEDRASHAFGNLRTNRTQTQFGPKGYAYIYLIYGMYFCFNATSGRTLGKPEAVLLRSIEPFEGIEIMKRRRPCARGNILQLANGPGKLCMALGLSKKQNGTDLCVSPLHIDTGETISEKDIVSSPRIGVEYANEWKDKPWRFYIKDNPFVSAKAT
jgi:DNA-3-methyladenine glycosylase